MLIEPARPDELETIKTTYAQARVRQVAVGSPVWAVFTDESIRGELAEGRVFRMTSGAVLAGYFTVAYADPAIWGERETGEHIYLHRIARGPEYVGPGLMPEILAWSRGHARARSRVGVRLDTWAENPAIIAYYERSGFRLLGSRRMEADPRLPVHYHGNVFALMEEERLQPPR